MGGAFVGLADDANSVYWNPAGMVQVKQQEATFMHGLYSNLGNVSYDYLGYVYPMRYAAVGLGWAGLGATFEQGENNQTTKYGENTWILSYAINPALFGQDMLLIGGNLKRLTIESGLENGAGIALDFGALFKPFTWGQLGVTYRNVAADVKDESFKSTWRVGLASRLWSDKIHLAADIETKEGIENAKGVSIRHHFGLEWQVVNALAVRGGLDHGRPAAGLTVSYRPFSVEYAFLSNELTGAAHRMGLNVQFGTPVFSETAKSQSEKDGRPKPPVAVKGGSVDGKAVLFWDASPTKNVLGYNFYLKTLSDGWVKVNKKLGSPEKLGASVEGEKGSSYEFVVTAVGVNEKESEYSESVKVDVR